jgi:hypothetical protein
MFCLFYICTAKLFLMPHAFFNLTLKSKVLLIISTLFIVNTKNLLAQAPIISTFSPTSGAQGTSVSITGANFTGVNSVKFGGVNAGSGYTNLADNATYTGTQTLALNSLSDSMSGYKYRCVTASGGSYIFTLKFENVWTGAVNNSWENAANWSCGTLPTQYTDVIINSGSNLVLGANGICQSLTLMPGSSLTELPGFTLTIVH